jgi:NRPS condensation-like uncharacterized protein
METFAKFNSKNVEDILPLTPMQENMLYQYLRAPKSRLYFEQTCYELTGNLETAKVKRAWNVVAAANEMLRTLFRWQELKKPVQVILKNHMVPIKEMDLSSLTTGAMQRQLDRVKEQDRQNPLDLNRQPFRVILCKTTKNKYEMIVSNHHIIYDGWSNVIILKELAEAYNRIYLGKKCIKPAKNSYKEYIKLQQHQDKIKQTRYWKSFLKGFTGTTSFSAHYSSHQDAPLPEGEEKRYEYPLPGDLQKKINAFSRREGVTLASLFYGAWAILIHKYNQVEDIIFGITVSGRDPRVKGIQDMVGLFINTLPLRLHISPADNINDFLKKVKKVLLEMEPFETTPLAEIMRSSEIGPTQTLFDSVVVIQNYPLDEAWFKEESQLRIGLTTRFYMTKINLALGVRAFQRIILDFSYNVNVFNERQIKRLSRQMVTVLKTIVANTGTGGISSAQTLKIKDIEILEPQEKEKIVFNIRENRKKLKAIEEVDFDEIF